MRYLALFLMLVSLCAFTVGCAAEKPKPVETPAVDAGAAGGEAAAEPAAEEPAAEPAAAEPAAAEPAAPAEPAKE